MLNDSHLYVLLDPRKPGKFKYGDLPEEFEFEPYYIGISRHESRRFYHLTCDLSYNNLKNNKIKKIIREVGIDKAKSLAIKLIDNLTRDQAKELEIKYISTIGRLNLGTGPLVNSTAGGDGTKDLSGKDLYLRAKHIKESRSGRSVYSKTPDETKLALSESMSSWFLQNRNKTYDDLPKMIERRFCTRSFGVQGGDRNGNSYYYYLIISPDGIYYIVGRGCLRYLATQLGISHTTLEDSAKRNERRSDGKFARIMRGSAYGYYSFRFKSIKECPVNITMGNQHPSLP